MHPAIQPTDVTGHTPGNWRALGALGQRFFPGFEHFRHGARLIRVDTHLVDVAQLLAATQGWREGCRDPDFRLHVENELLDFGRPARHLRRLRPQVSTMLEILVFPDMNDLVQRSCLRMPEGCQRRDFDTIRQRFPKVFFGLRHGTGFQRIGTEFVDTHRAFLSLVNLSKPTPTTLVLHGTRTTQGCIVRPSWQRVKMLAGYASSSKSGERQCDPHTRARSCHAGWKPPPMPRTARWAVEVLRS